MPYPINSAQQFEKENDAVFYTDVFKAPVIPYRPVHDDEGKPSRKIWYKYDKIWTLSLLK